MPTTRDLCTWLRHNIEDLRLTPDMVTEAPGSTVRFRWHGLATIDGSRYGLGVDLRPGPSVGAVWLYGFGLHEVRLRPGRAVLLPPSVRESLRSILLSHVADRERNWGRGRELLHRARTRRDRAVA